MPCFAVPRAHAGVNPTTWEHEDFKITKPDSLKEASPIRIFKAALTMHFDGGYKHKIGTAGYIGWDCQGKCIDGCGMCYQDVPRKMTHNVAEMWAERDYLEFIEVQGYLKSHKTIVARGGSQLIVNFMLKKFKPGQDFSPTVQAMQTKCTGWRK